MITNGGLCCDTPGPSGENTVRYPPIPKEQWGEEQKAVASAIVSGPRGELRGPFVPLLHAPALAAKVQELGEVIRFKTSIPDAVLEIAVLMTARHHDCANIWESHALLAAKSGVSREIMIALAGSKRPETVNGDEALVYEFCSELLGPHKVTDATFARTTGRWGHKGAMELAGICGYYAMLAAVLNTAERPLVDDSSVPFGI